MENITPTTTPANTAAPMPDAPKAKPTITRRIGNTTYRVRVHYSRTSKETMNDKIIRMMKNEAMGKAANW